jgi:transcriptional regulator with XRE-family HTH domain
VTGNNPHPFGRLLVALRKQKGLTQDELAARMQTTKRMISYFERHAKNPGIATVERLATALGVPKEKLLERGGEEDRAGPAVRSRMLQRAWQDAARLPLRDQQYLAKLIQGLVEQNGLKPRPAAKG